MALGQVQINNLNLMQGPVAEIEHHFLFVGRGSGTSEDTVLSVNTDTDLDAVIGSSDSTLKSQLQAAKLNAGQNWVATVVPLASGTTWQDGVDMAMAAGAVEAVVVTDPVSSSSDVAAMHAKAAEIMGQYMRPLFFIATGAGIDGSSESWSDYTARVKNLVNDVAAANVMVVPTIYGPDQGALAGRLCNRSVTVADTPMRVQTGGLIGSEFANKPADNTSRELDMAILKDLADERLSVPQWYPDIAGIYWGDGVLLDIQGGDYQVVENLRVVQKAMRRVYPLAVSRIGDRKLNSTPASMEASKSVFMKPLLEMSHSVDILGIPFPGEIEPPQDGDIVISWKSKYEVDIYMMVRPYNCPKKIGVNIALDLNNYA